MDEALLRNSPAGHGQLVKIFITVEPQGIFGSYLAYLFVLKLSSHWYAKRLRGLCVMFLCFVAFPCGVLGQV